MMTEQMVEVVDELVDLQLERIRNAVDREVETGVYEFNVSADMEILLRLLDKSSDLEVELEDLESEDYEDPDEY